MVFNFHIPKLATWAAIGLIYVPIVNAASTKEEGMQLGGSVPDICLLAAPVSNGGGVNAQFQSGTEDNSQVLITSLANEESGVLNPASITLDFNGTCNFAHSVILTSSSGGLRNEIADINSGGFTSVGIYAATMNWNGLSESLTLNGQEGAFATLSQISANSGVLTLSVDIPGGGSPLVAGTYSDVLTIEFGGTL